MIVQSSTRTAVVLALALTLPACAMREPVRGQDARGLDPKLSTFAYIEDNDIGTLIVDTQPARDRDGAPYMPIEFALANKAQRQLRVTRESFTLRDEKGNRYPAATPQELLQNYDFLDIDRELRELEGITFARFGATQRYPSNFSPAHANPAVVRDLVSIPKHGYIIDMIYFPTPATGIRGHAFELFVSSPDLEEPLFVKFEVR